MLDLKFVRENIEVVKENTISKNSKADVEEISRSDEKRRALIQEADNLKNLRNVVSKEIAELKKNKIDADEKIAEMKKVSDRIKELDDVLRETETEVKSILLNIPNMLSPDVPKGRSAEENLVIREYGDKKQSSGKDHLAIGKELGLFDFERGGKVTGAGFPFYTGLGARLERSLINFFLDFHTKRGYHEMMPPFVVNASSMQGTGQLPKMKDDMYHDEEEDLYLIPTAEVPLTNYHADEIMPAEELTKKICGYSPCFRREAGSYGKDVRGFLRVHQFNKVELVKFTKPEDSYNELELLVADVEELLKALGLTYRVILLCSGDTSFSSAKTYDLEVWSPAEEKWLEVSSCSNFESFQARRANIRFRRDSNSKPEFVHTLNGSGLATPRILVALLENYYNEGKLELPDVLMKYINS